MSVFWTKKRPHGYVCPEYPDGLVDAARAFQDLGLKILRITGIEVPSFLTAGAAGSLGLRCEQFKYPLVPVLPLGQFDQGGQQPSPV